MSKGRRTKPDPYVEGPRKQMTITWKKLVLAKLADNEKNGSKPANPAQLAKMLKGGKGADKRGIYETFNLDRDPPQMSSAYVDEICELLKIGPPMNEAPEDITLERDLDVVRALDPEARRALIALAQQMTKR